MQRWAEEAPVKIRLTRQQADRLRQDWYYRQAVLPTNARMPKRSKASMIKRKRVCQE